VRPTARKALDGVVRVMEHVIGCLQSHGHASSPSVAQNAPAENPQEGRAQAAAVVTQIPGLPLSQTVIRNGRCEGKERKGGSSDSSCSDATSDDPSPDEAPSSSTRSVTEASTPTSNTGSSNSESACPICYEQTRGDSKALTTICEHTMHSECLEKWQSRCDQSYHPFTCPVCRHPLARIFNLERLPRRSFSAFDDVEEDILFARLSYHGDIVGIHGARNGARFVQERQRGLHNNLHGNIALFGTSTDDDDDDSNYADTYFSDRSNTRPRRTRPSRRPDYYDPMFESGASWSSRFLRSLSRNFENCIGWSGGGSSHSTPMLGYSGYQYQSRVRDYHPRALTTSDYMMAGYWGQ